MPDIGKGRLRHAADRRITRLDNVILIRCMRAAAVPGTEVTPRQAHRGTGENITRPGAGEARREADRQPFRFIDRHRSLDERRILIGLSWVVAAGDLALDIAVPTIAQVSLQ